MLFSNLGGMKGGTFDDDTKDSFFKFHHDRQRQQQQQEMYQPQPQFHQMDITQKRECHSDDLQADSRSTSGDSLPVIHHPFSSEPNKPKKDVGGGVGRDETGSIEVGKRPRGRPRGSKNKPKPLPSVAPDTSGESADNAPMRTYMIEIPGGCDVVDALTRFSRRRDLGISVLSGTGTVSDVTFCQPGGSNLTFHGLFEILSISATFFPPSFTATVTGSVSISIAGTQGQVVGGSVTGQLLAAGTVTVVAAAFSKPSFHRLPVEEEQTVSSPGDGGKSTNMETPHLHPQPLQRHLEQLHQQHTSVPGGSRTPPPFSGSAGMSLYGTHLAGDVIWAPTARASPPPPPPY